MPTGLTLFKKLSLTAACLISLAGPLTVGLVNIPSSCGQPPNRQQTGTAAAPLAFDVTSVKPSSPDSRVLMMIRPLPGGQTYIARNIPLRLMIKVIYRITDCQIAGGPGWIDTERYDIDAKADRPSTMDQMHEMFRTLLAERFQLRFHRETRRASAYIMTVVKSGAKLKLSETQEQFDVPMKPDSQRRMVGTRVPMSYLAWFLSQQLAVPVINDTALEGYYDFTLQWQSLERVPGLLGPGSPPVLADPSDEPGILVALREQLGLRLQQRKAPVEVFVIDHAARPAAN